MRIPLIAFLLVTGASIPSGTTAMSVAENINRFHTGCNGKADMRGGDCIAAAHRYCEERYSKRSFGFLYRRDVNRVYIGCAPRGWYGDAAYSTLSQFHQQCRSAADAPTPHCGAAVRRYCENEIKMGGGLVQEIGPRSVAVACFKPSRYADVSYSNLSQFSRDCRAPGNAGSIGCSTAAAAWCKAGKDDELGLAQEIGPASIGVACFHGFTQVMDIYNPQQL